MGEAELQAGKHLLIIHSMIHIYGDAAGEDLSLQLAADIAAHWNEGRGTVLIGREKFDVYFDIKGIYNDTLTPDTVIQNTDPRNNFFRIEEYAVGDISF